MQKNEVFEGLAELETGQRIKIIRKKMRRTLQDIADTTGLSASVLSQVERGVAGASITSIKAIAEALGVPLSRLLDPPPQPEAHTRSGTRVTFSANKTQQRFERLSAKFPGSVIEALKVFLPVGFHSDFVSHDGEELVYVLEGQVQYHLEDGDYVLSPGDSIHIDSHRKHQLKNIGQVEAVIISVGTLPLFDA